MRDVYIAAAAAVIWLVVAMNGPLISSAPTEPSPTEKPIKLIGATCAYPPLQMIASAFVAQAKNTRVALLPGSQTTGGIEGVRSGIADIGVVARELTPSESSGLQYRALAVDLLAVAVHPTVSELTNLSADQVRSIFGGAARNWRSLGGPDAEILVLDRPEDDAAKVVLRRHYLGNQKNSTAAVVMDVESELASALENTPYSIGTVSVGYSLSRSLTVRFLSIDGIAPTIDNATKGRYAMSRTLGLVWKSPSREATQRFLDYTFGEEGGSRLRRAGLLPLGKAE